MHKYYRNFRNNDDFSLVLRNRRQQENLGRVQAVFDVCKEEARPAKETSQQRLKRTAHKSDWAKLSCDREQGGRGVPPVLQNPCIPRAQW
jgi:hypothetical protein